LILNK